MMAPVRDRPLETAVVLAGGLGSRLAPAVGAVPKVLARVGGRPFLERLLDQLSEARAGRALLCVGHRAGEVRAELGASYRGLALEYSEESSPLGTAGCLRPALPRLGAADVLVMNGDSYLDVPLLGLWSAHLAGEAAGSLAVVHVPDAGRYGRVELDASGRVLGFAEKPSPGRPGLVNAGVYCFRRELLEAIPEGNVSLERDMLPAWAPRLQGIVREAAFLDIGTPESYARAEGFFAGLPSR